MVQNPESRPMREMGIQVRARVSNQELKRGESQNQPHVAIWPQFLPSFQNGEARSLSCDAPHQPWKLKMDIHLICILWLKKVRLSWG